jgi:alkanesulfonate monooxygenase SsuD/methylene tetrahydromethanopterin reductase-like flavin-dependent oxidoreductase (luciferase family)
VVTGQHQLTWPQLVEQWQFAEELGFDAIFLFDHFMALYGDPDGPCLEASTLLAALALKTSRIRLGVLVYGNTHRHPAVFAKEMTTVDHVSGGRVIVGIGTGWNEREHAAFAIPFPPAGERVEMLEESIQAMRSLFTERRTTFHGAYYRFDDAPFAPKPLQAHVPIMVGGERPRMLKLIAKHADIWDSGRTPEGLRDDRRPLRGDRAGPGRDRLLGLHGRGQAGEPDRLCGRGPVLPRRRGQPAPVRPAAFPRGPGQHSPDRHRADPWPQGGVHIAGPS